MRKIHTNVANKACWTIRESQALVEDVSEKVETENSQYSNIYQMQKEMRQRNSLLDFNFQWEVPSIFNLSYTLITYKYRAYHTKQVTYDNSVITIP